MAWRGFAGVSQVFAAVGPQTFHGGEEFQPSRRPWGHVAMTGDLGGFSWEEMVKDVFFLRI